MSPPLPPTFLVHYFIRENVEEEFTALISEIADRSHGKDGCLSYSVYRNRTDIRVFAVFEQYEDSAALLRHREALYARFGPPSHSPSRLPQQIAEKIEHFEYWPVERLAGGQT